WARSATARSRMWPSRSSVLRLSCTLSMVQAGASYPGGGRAPSAIVDQAWTPPSPGDTTAAEPRRKHHRLPDAQGLGVGSADWIGDGHRRRRCAVGLTLVTGLGPAESSRMLPLTGSGVLTTLTLIPAAGPGSVRFLLCRHRKLVAV